MARRRVPEAESETAISAKDPNHCWAETFEHPVFGHVVLRYQGDELRRIKWSANDQGQNVHSRYNNPNNFAEILRKLGIDR